MNSKWIRFCYPLLITFAAVAFAQAPTDPGIEKVFHLTNTTAPRAIQEIVNAIRMVVDTRDVKADDTAMTVTVRGTSDQISLAGWVLPQLDRAAGPQPPQSAAPPDYRLGGSSNAVVRVFYLANTATPQGMQEIINGIRSVFEIQRVSAVNGPKAIIVRGTAEQIAGGSWLVGATDRAANAPRPSVPLSFTINDPRNPAAQIFYLSAGASPQAVQEIVNSVRSLCDLQRVVAIRQPNIIAARGTASQIAMAQWLVGALDKSAPPPSSAQSTTTPYSVDTSGEVARVFYLPPASPEAIQDLVAQVRANAHIQRVVACNTPRAVAVRGTTGQVALAEKLLQDMKM